jgi:hypothetical protein
VENDDEECTQILEKVTEVDHNRDPGTFAKIMLKREAYISRV